MDIIYRLREKYYKILDVITENITEIKTGFSDGLAGKPREYTYFEALKEQSKEFESLKNQGIVKDWNDYKKLKEKQGNNKE